MQALIAYTECMIRKHREQPKQLTVRGVPNRVKERLLLRASREGKSLNTILVEILTNATGLETMSMNYRDLSKFAGSWVEDSAFDAAIDAQDQIDESLWQ